VTENPNAYDDDAYTEAVNELQGNVPEIIDKCWRAGASIDNLEDELQNALQESEAFEGRTVLVTLSIS
jgi:hypothetical protein